MRKLKVLLSSLVAIVAIIGSIGATQIASFANHCYYEVETNCPMGACPSWPTLACANSWGVSPTLTTVVGDGTFLYAQQGGTHPNWEFLINTEIKCKCKYTWYAGGGVYWYGYCPGNSLGYDQLPDKRYDVCF
jgi:hypothetical protein